MISPSVIDFYQSSKNKEWRKQVKDRQTAIFRFLEKNALSTIKLTDEEGEAIENLTLMRSHLSENGAKLFEKAIPAWERARDKDGDVSNVKQLEKALQKLMEIGF